MGNLVVSMTANSRTLVMDVTLLVEDQSSRATSIAAFPTQCLSCILRVLPTPMKSRT